MAQNFKIFVLCGGKSGSSTLHSTFINNDFKSLKIHSKLDYIEQFNCDKLFESIDLSAEDKQVFIIDVYRTPIERKISSFFENVQNLIPNWESLPIEELINIFNKDYLNKLEEYHSINEAFKHYNIPNFKNFDFKKKFISVEKDNKVFIKILYKDINNWKNILRHIFNKPIVMTNDNLSNGKNYFKAYQHFKLMYKVPKKYLNKLKKDTEFKIYNSPEDQKEYLDYWNKRLI